jgi:general secretion pathway protein G
MQRPLVQPARRPRPIRRAFSLVEVIVAVTIVALLAAIVAPRVYRFIFRANVSKAKAEATQLAQNVKLYMTESGLSRLPPDFELSWLTEGPDPYLESKRDLLDPWGNEYVIRVPGTDGRDFDIVSLGADGQPGGEGENADIIHGK